MDNAHPSRNGTIQLIVAVILTKTIILYCSYLYPYMQEFCAGSLVHGMMSSFYTVWCEICGIQCTYFGTFTNYVWFVFPSLHNRHYCFAFFRREGKSKVSEKCQKCAKREGIIAPMPSPVCVWCSSLTSPLPMLARKNTKKYRRLCRLCISKYMENDNKELTITEYLIKFNSTSNDF